MEICFSYNKDYDSWYLRTTSNFEHSYHIKETKESQPLNKSDLNKEQLTILNILYDNGVAPSVVVKANTMTEAVKLSAIFSLCRLFLHFWLPSQLHLT